MSDGRDRLRAWTLMDELVLDAYSMTRKTSADGWDDLPTAMRGAVLRAALRIVQGVHTSSGEGFDHSLRSALGTLAEYRYYLYLARRLGLIDLRRLPRRLRPPRARSEVPEGDARNRGTRDSGRGRRGVGKAG